MICVPCDPSVVPSVNWYETWIPTFLGVLTLTQIIKFSFDPSLTSNGDDMVSMKKPNREKVRNNSHPRHDMPTITNQRPALRTCMYTHTQTKTHTHIHTHTHTHTLLVDMYTINVYTIIREIFAL